jgi:hypothetical protein
MPCHFDEQPRLLDQHRAAPVPLGSLHFFRLHKLVEIRSKELSQVRMGGAIPGHGKHFSGRGGIFLHVHAGRSFHLMYRVGIAAGCPQTCLHLGHIGLHRCNVAAERSRRRKWNCKYREYSANDRGLQSVPLSSRQAVAPPASARANESGNSELLFGRMLLSPDCAGITATLHSMFFNSRRARGCAALSHPYMLIHKDERCPLLVAPKEPACA